MKRLSSALADRACGFFSLSVACVISTAALAQNTAQPAAPLNSLTQQLQSAGVKRCAGRIQQVTNFITGQSRSGTTVFPGMTNPDEGMISMSSEVVAGTSVTYVGMTFAPRGTDGCAGVYEAVTYWQNRCEEVMASPAFNNLKSAGNLQQVIRTASNQANIRFMFMPAGTGCVVIKKELIQ